jgi:hypothetical protein
MKKILIKPTSISSLRGHVDVHLIKSKLRSNLIKKLVYECL